MSRAHGSGSAGVAGVEIRIRCPSAAERGEPIAAGLNKADVVGTRVVVRGALCGEAVDREEREVDVRLHRWIVEGENHGLIDVVGRHRNQLRSRWRWC